MLKHSGFEASKSVYVELMVLIFILAYFTWRYVENPFRKKQRFNQAAIFMLSALLMIFFIVLGYLGHRSNGFDERAHMLVFKDLSYNTAVLGYTQCENFLDKNDPKLNYCYGANKLPNALVVGDSHADDKFYGIEKSIKAYNWTLVGNSSCPPLLGVRVKSADSVECTERLNKLFAYIDEQKTLKVVVLSFAHMYPLDKLIAADHIQLRFDPKDSVIEDTSNPTLGKVDAFYAGLARTVDFLTSRNIKTVILLDVPELTFFPYDCLKDKVNCGFNKSDVVERQKVLREHVASIRLGYKDVLVFDSLDVFCDASTCNILKEGRSMYRDSHHLSHFGSIKYGEFLSDWLSKNTSLM